MNLDPDIIKANEINRRLLIRINGVTLPWNDVLKGFDVYDAFGLSMSSNPIINGGFLVNQREITSHAVLVGTTPFVLDRWRTHRGGISGGLTVSRVDKVDDRGSPYAMRLQRVVGDTSTAKIYAQHTMPRDDAKRFAGRQMTVGWRAKRGADLSSILTQTAVYAGTGALNESLFTGLTGVTTLGYSDFNPPIVWTDYQLTFQVPLGSTQLAIETTYIPSGTAGVNDWLDVSDYSLIEGSAAMPPFYRPEGEELLLCRRYMYRIGSKLTASSEPVGEARATSATVAQLTLRHPVRMLRTPSIELPPTAAGFKADDATVNNAATLTGLSAIPATPDAMSLNFTTTGLTTGRPVLITGNPAVPFNAYADITAEI